MAGYFVRRARKRECESFENRIYIDIDCSLEVVAGRRVTERYANVALRVMRIFPVLSIVMKPNIQVGDYRFKVFKMLLLM